MRERVWRQEIACQRVWGRREEPAPLVPAELLGRGLELRDPIGCDLGVLLFLTVR
jgi:hypothetical protein